MSPSERGPELRNSGIQEDEVLGHSKHRQAGQLDRGCQVGCGNLNPDSEHPKAPPIARLRHRLQSIMPRLHHVILGEYGIG